jgi:undecaprenyl-diphosphatase
MQALDQNILTFFAEHRLDWLSFLMLVITYAGSYLVIGGLTFISVIFFYLHRHSIKILPFLVAIGGSAISVFLLKNIFYRARPFMEALYTETTPAFPSGHATMAFALYGFIIYEIWKHEKHPLKTPSIILLSVLIILIGLSRLYLGVHYLSDVLVGYAIGLVWILISIKLSKKRRN